MGLEDPGDVTGAGEDPVEVDQGDLAPLEDQFESIVFGDPGGWYWHVVSAGNHEIILTSESHHNRKDVVELALRMPWPVYEHTREGRVQVTATTVEVGD